MFNEDEAREKLAQLARIFAMQGMLGLFGHLSVYNPEKKRVFITPGMGSDKGQLRPEDMVPCDLDGKPQGSGRPPVEWPIHTALHAARSDALAVAHLHPPHATLFTIAKREFRPVTLQGTLFSAGVPLYQEAQLVTTPERGRALVNEDDAKKTLQAATLGEVETLSAEQARAFNAEIDLERRAERAWNYFSSVEARWDRQPGTGRIELFP